MNKSFFKHFFRISSIFLAFVAIISPIFFIGSAGHKIGPSFFWAIDPDPLDSHLPDLIDNKIKRIPPSYNYQDSKWYLHGNLDPYEIFNPSFKKCLLCNFDARNYNSDSTPRDAIFTFMFNEIAGLLPFTRSLRTTGSRCHAFIFSDDASLSKITQDELMVLDRCAITLVDTGYFDSKDWKQIVLLKYPVFFDFLFMRRNLIDRVIIVDLYDSVFQGDPFTSDFKKDTFYFVAENSSIENCWINNMWLQQAAPDSYEEIKNNKILNSGLFMGGTLQVLRFLDLYLTFYENKDKTNLAPDQGYFNFVAYTIVLKDYTFKTKVLTENDGVIVMGYFQESHTKLIFGNFKPKLATIYPRIIHQYDTRSELSASVLHACPKGKLNASNYIRNLHADTDVFIDVSNENNEI